jgi:quercetin dioxygenase-like cupin family protein
MSKAQPRIVVTRKDEAEWSDRGLRPFVEYRDLGLGEASGGKAGATIARVVRKFEPGGGAKRHYHETAYHLIFVLRGWFRSEFEGLGEVTLREGDSLAYQGEIPQAHIEYSDDFQVLQITAPATFRTVNLEK